jgi:hypothetical protein
MHPTIAEARKPCHGDNMVLRRTVFVVAMLGFAAGPAVAINWDGHDDWLADHPAAQALEAAGGHDLKPPLLRPRPERVCQPREDVGEVPANPYEPVPPLCAPAVIGN